MRDATVLPPAEARSPVRAASWALRVLLVICAVAAGMRLMVFDRVPPNPFYDAAVRSMGLSWHNFFYGAFEPGGSVSVDKAPVDLWLQVGATKLLGFSSTSLRLPQAIAGTLAVPLLYDLVRRGFGRPAGLVAASALAVLPVSVLTGRSDTMDTLMGTALLLAAWVVVAAPPARRHRGVVSAGAIAGLAFEIKLFEAAVAFPAIFALAWLSFEGPEAGRRRALRHGLLAFVGVAAAWPLAASLLPGAHPWPIGSTNGAIWNVVLVFDGLDRLGASGVASAALAHPGPLRLFTSRPPDYLKSVGLELLPALLLGGVALATAVHRGAARRATTPADRTRRALGVGIAVWLICGFVLFSLQGRLRLRYMEAFTPAIAAALGIGLVLCVGELARRGRWHRAEAPMLVALAAAALLAWPLMTSVQLARTGAEDAQTLGARPAAETDALSRYLGRHQAGTVRVASGNTVVAGPLIVRDARPVMMLTSWRGQQFTTPAELVAAVRAGEVRHLLLDEVGCRTPRAASCTPVVRWALAHAMDVSARAGLGTGLLLLELHA